MLVGDFLRMSDPTALSCCAITIGDVSRGACSQIGEKSRPGFESGAIENPKESRPKIAFFPHLWEQIGENKYLFLRLCLS